MQVRLILQRFKKGIEACLLMLLAALVLTGIYEAARDVAIIIRNFVRD